MSTNMKKAFMKGIPCAIAAWVFYGLFTTLFDDDSIFEQMFESNGIFFAVSMAIAAVVFYYRKGMKEASVQES